MPDLSALFSQMQSLMQPHDGPVNWDLAIDVARKLVAQAPDPSPSQRQQDAVADAVRLADHWLDERHRLPLRRPHHRGLEPRRVGRRHHRRLEGAGRAGRRARRRRDGRGAPEEAQAMAGPLLGMLGKMTGAMFATQVGSALGGLAGEVLTASDIGLPLGPAGQAALVPTNVTAFAEGLDVDENDVLLYLALREAAHQRLFAHVPWLRDHLIGAVADYARGIEIDVTGIEEQMRGIDPTNPAAMQEALEGGLFEPQQTPAQKAALSRLEVTLALVEGWVDEVVGQATAERMPAAAEAAGGRSGAAAPPAVRPRRPSPPWSASSCDRAGCATPPRCGARCAPARAVEARDGVWMHPDLLPTADDLDDPLGFREDASAPRRAERRRLRRRAAEPARRRPRHRRRRPGAAPTTPRRDPARRRPGAAARLDAADARAGGAPGAVRRPPGRPPRRDAARLLPRPPHGQHPGGVGRRRPRCC